MVQSIKIFIPLGTQKFQFNRLVKAMNKLVRKGVYKPEEIVMQSAIYEEMPLFTHYKLIPLEYFNELINKAELVITHSGVNSIITCMSLGKPLIIVPRQKQYGEHVDNHQLEIAEVMKLKYNVIIVDNLEMIEETIKITLYHKYKPWVSHNNELVDFIKQLVKDNC